MQSKVEKFIKDNHLLSPKSKVILGVSGGADSIALLNILHNAGHEVIVAHCNFHLREAESQRDEIFVKQICENQGHTYRTINFDTIKFAADNSLSIEMAARKLRYDWFEQLRQEYKAEAIAVAHHRDDSVETVIMNMIRGTGIKGLTGISPKVGYIIRPFLSITRDDVEQYVKKMGLPYVTDSTNNESIYTRNIIRLDVMPYFERINPSAKESLFKTVENLQQVEKIYSHYIEEAKKNVLKDDHTISIEELKKTVEPKAVLFEILNVYGFKSNVVDEVYQALDKESGKFFHSHTHSVLKDRDTLIIEKKN